MKVFSIISTLFFMLGISQAQAQGVSTYVEEPSGGFKFVGYNPHDPSMIDYGRPNVKRYDVGGSIEAIRTRGKVRCGSNLQVKSFAYKEDGSWYGIDADFCRVFALAILGDNDKIEMVDVKPKDVAKALNSSKIDVMLSGASYSAAMETSNQALSAGLLYYDHQFLLAMTEKDDLSAEELHGKKVCLSTDTDYYKNFEDYNMRYNVAANYLTFANLDEAKRAFLLKRCDLMTASGLMLNGILKDLPTLKAKILKNYIALHPIYAFVQKDNNELRLAIKWILNALFLAEQYGMNVQNREYFATNDNPEIRNLLGDNPQLWQNLGLRPTWVKEAVALIGNYADIYDKNMGKDSDYKIQRREGRLVKDGGTIYPIPFI